MSSDPAMPDADELREVLVRSSFGSLSAEHREQLAAQLELQTLDAGQVLFLQGDEADALYVVLRGELEAYLTPDDGGELVLSRMGPSATAGEIQLVMGGRRSASVRASAPSVLARLDRERAAELVSRFPAMLEGVAQVIRERLRRDELVQLLPRLFGSIDEATLREVEQATRWVSIRRGERLIRQGQAGEQVYFLVNGRLRAVLEEPGQAPRILSEITRGELVGELALFSDQHATASVYAQRDSELAGIDYAGFEALVARHPQILRSITRSLVQRGQDAAAPSEQRQHIAILPLGEDVPARAFGAALVQALSAHESVFHLTAERLDQQLGMAAAQLPEDSHFTIRTRAWMYQLQSQYRFVIYEADASDSEWTRRCLRNADEIILLGRGDADPTPSAVEQGLLAEREATAAKTRLVLLHERPDARPQGTREWLDPRRVELHHHVRWWQPAECMARLARFLRGRAVGLALGGGGARGMAHIGVITALRERQIPIDFVGGTSAGGMVSGQYAMGREPDQIHAAMKDAMQRHKPFSAYNLPLVSLVGASRLRRVAQELYQDIRIEDLWLNYFCVSCNLSTGDTVVHRNGLLWEAVRATTALPGILVPMVQDGKLLVDGGVVDNLPGAIMGEFTGGPVILCDVSPDPDPTVYEHEIPPVSRILWSWLMPHRKKIRAPSIADVIIRTSVLSSLKRREQAEQLAVLLLHPPIQGFGMLEFRSFDALVEVGYRYGLSALDAWQQRAEHIDAPGAAEPADAPDMEPRA